MSPAGRGSPRPMRPWPRWTKPPAWPRSSATARAQSPHGTRGKSRWPELPPLWPSDIPDEVYSQTPRRNVIDDAVLGQLRRLNLKPSPRSSDSEFIRRVHLDVVGMLPTPEVTRAFLADPSETKRDAMIESSARPAGVRRLLDLPAVRPVFDQRPQAPPRRAQVVLSMAARRDGNRQPLGSNRAAGRLSPG